MLPMSPGEWLSRELARLQRQHAAQHEMIETRYKERCEVNPIQQTYLVGLVGLVLAGLLTIIGILFAATLIAAWVAIILTAASVGGTIFWCATNTALSPGRARAVAEMRRREELDEEQERYLREIADCRRRYEELFLAASPDRPLLP